MAAALRTFRCEGLNFEVDDSGGGGDPVILLHGYPESKESWDGVTPLLTAAGYRVLAPNQRGYSPGARPRGRRSYALGRLVGDVLALADAAGADRFHLVGHDWGGAVAWSAARAHPDRVGTLTSLATPHSRALRRSMLSSGQALRSWYVLFYQLPWLPELSVTRQPLVRIFRRTLVRTGLPDDRARAYVGLMRSGAAGPAINWYRALPFRAPAGLGPVAVPTLYVYGMGDFALGRRAADLTSRYVRGPYRCELLEGVGHWIPERAPEATARLLLDHFRSHPLGRPAGSPQATGTTRTGPPGTSPR